MGGQRPAEGISLASVASCGRELRQTLFVCRRVRRDFQQRIQVIFKAGADPVVEILEAKGLQTAFRRPVRRQHLGGLFHQSSWSFEDQHVLRTFFDRLLEKQQAAGDRDFVQARLGALASWPGTVTRTAPPSFARGDFRASRLVPAFTGLNIAYRPNCGEITKECHSADQ